MSSLAALSSELAAQVPVREPRGALSINPLGIPFGYVALEYEGRVAPAFSLGVSTSYYGDGDGDRYSAIDLKARLYPNEIALRGFAIGMTAGYTSQRDAGCVTFSGGSCRGSNGNANIGVEVDYNWLLGKTDRFFLGSGIGAKRRLGNNDSNSFIDGDAILFARFQIGVAF